MKQIQTKSLVTGDSNPVSKYCKQVLNDFQYTQQHPYRSALKSLFSIRSNAHFKIAIHLNLITLEDKIQALIQILEQQSFSDEEKLKKMRSRLYESFEKLAENATDEKQALSLKAFKKLIHAFDREMTQTLNDINHSCRIFNLDKLRRKINQEIEQLTKDSEIRKRREQLQRIDYLTQNNQKRTYAYLSDINAWPIPAEDKKQIRRQFKKKLKTVALLISIIIGCSEAITAAFLIGTVAPALIPVLVLSVFFCNYYLFKQDIYHFLKDLLYGKTFKKTNHLTFNKKEKILAITALLLSFTTAVFFFFLSLSSTMAFLTLIGFASNPIGLSVVSALIAGLVAIALFAIFAHTSLHWIRTGGPEKLKHKLMQFKKKYIDFWKTNEWKQKTNIQKFLYISKKILTILFYLTFLALAIGLVVVISLMTAGSIKHQSATMLQTLFYASLATSNMIAHILTLTLNVINNILFSSIGISKTLSLVKIMARSLIHPQQTYQNLIGFFQLSKKTPIRLIYQIIYFIKQAILLTCVGISAFSGHNTSSPSWIKSIVGLKLNIKIVKLVNTLSSIIQSAINYASGITATCQLPPAISSTENACISTKKITFFNQEKEPSKKLISSEEPTSSGKPTPSKDKTEFYAKLY